jgi:hypothetical protein
LTKAQGIGAFRLQKDRVCASEGAVFRMSVKVTKERLAGSMKTGPKGNARFDARSVQNGHFEMLNQLK